MRIWLMAMPLRVAGRLGLGQTLTDEDGVETFEMSEHDQW